MDTAGRTVFFAGLTVMIALLGLLLLGLAFLQGAAIASALAVLFTMLAALTLLPAMLSRFGGWIDRLRLPAPGAQAPRGGGRRAGTGREPDLGALVGDRAAPPVAAADRRAADPARRSRYRRCTCASGTSDAGLDPPDTTTRKAYDIVADRLRRGHERLVPARGRSCPRRAMRPPRSAVVDAVEDDPDVARVAPPQLSEDGEVATVVAVSEERAAGRRDDAAARPPARRAIAAGASERPGRRSTSAARSPRRRTSRA